MSVVVNESEDPVRHYGDSDVVAGADSDMVYHLGPTIPGNAALGDRQGAVRSRRDVMDRPQFQSTLRDGSR